MMISFNMLFAVLLRDPSAFAMFSGTGLRGYSKAKLKSIAWFSSADAASNVLIMLRLASTVFIFPSFNKLTFWLHCLNSFTFVLERLSWNLVSSENMRSFIKSEQHCSPISRILSMPSACSSSIGIPELRLNNRSGDQLLLKGLVKSSEIEETSMFEIFSQCDVDGLVYSCLGHLQYQLVA